MGLSSPKEEKIQSSVPQNIHIYVHLNGLQDNISSKNVSNEFQVSNGFSIFERDGEGEGEAPPSIGQEQKKINSYNNQPQNIKEQPKNKNINDSLDYSISQQINIDNNRTDTYLNKNNEKYNNNRNNINPNIKIDENLYPKKETSKGSKYKEEINPNFGNKLNPENYNFFTKTGNEKIDEKKNFISPGENKNKDNNVIHESNLHPLENSNNDLSQSALLASFQNLNFSDPKDLLKIKEIANQKFNEGYFPLFLKMNHKYTFYYLKKGHTLNGLLKAHLNNLGVPYCGKNYLFYNKGKQLDPNIPVIEIEDLSIFSPIEIKEIE